MSAQVAAKIVRSANAARKVPEPIEIDVAQALVDLENSVPELKTELRPLQISAAKEVDVRGGKKAIVVFVPVPQLKAFHKVQQRCVPIFSSIALYFAQSTLPRGHIARTRSVLVFVRSQPDPRAGEKVRRQARRLRRTAPHPPQGDP